jgi:hypothetical protein
MKNEKTIMKTNIREKQVNNPKLQTRLALSYYTLLKRQKLQSMKDT